MNNQLPTRPLEFGVRIQILPKFNVVVQSFIYDKNFHEDPITFDRDMIRIMGK